MCISLNKPPNCGVRCKDTEKMHSSEVYASRQHFAEDVLLLHLHKAGPTKPQKKKNITQLYGKRQDSICLHQLRIRFSEMDRQMSCVRRMEHIQGTADSTVVGNKLTLAFILYGSFQTCTARQHRGRRGTAHRHGRRRAQPRSRRRPCSWLSRTARR